MQGITNVLTKLINDKVEEIYINTERFRNSTDRKDVYKYIIDEETEAMIANIKVGYYIYKPSFIFEHLINETILKDMIDFVEYFYSARSEIIEIIFREYFSIITKKYRILANIPEGPI